METLSVERAHLSRAHGRKVAVRLMTGGGERVVVGRGFYEADPELGRVLRIRFAANEDGELLIAENAFSGELLPGEPAGCDFLVQLD